MDTTPEPAADSRTDAQRQAWVEANLERTRLREQSWRQHKTNMEHEERRYQADLDQIDRVYALRTGEPA